MMRGRSITETQRPAGAPVDIDNGKLDWRDGMLGGAFVLSSLAVGALGGLLTLAVMPSYTGDPISPWRSALGLTGGLIAITSLGFGLTFALLKIRSWWMHAQRVEAWDELQRNAFEAQGGKEVERTASEWEFDADSVRDMVALVTQLHFQLAYGSGDKAPWAQRNMQGNMLLRGSRLLFEVSDHEARKAGERLETLGIIRNRGGKQNSPGEWTCETLEEAVMKVADNWHKIRS